MAHLLRLMLHGAAMVFACWWLLQPLHSYAAFPATLVPENKPGGVCYNSPCYEWAHEPGFPYHATPQLAAQSAIGASKAGCGTVSAVSGVGLAGGGFPNYYANYVCAPNSTPQGPYGISPRTRAAGPPQYTCPANSTLSGSSCTCNAGYVQEGSACVVDPVVTACEALSGQTAYLSFAGAVSPGGASCSSTGCAATVGSPVIRARTPGGAWVSEADAVFTGSTCTPSPTQPEAAPDPCRNGQQGEVNGVTVCIPYSGSDEVVKESGTTKTETAGADTTVTSTSTSTTCTNNSCTTTVTTNVSVNGGAPTTSTTETTEPRDDYCTANPRAPQCRESSFGGSCDSGFTCQGDAVQCAQAQQLHRLACVVTQASDESALYAVEKNPAGGPADIPSNTVDVGPGSLEAGNALGVSACIPDLAITVAGTAVSLPLSNVCPYLAHLRLMLLAVAWLMAFRIVARD